MAVQFRCLTFNLWSFIFCLSVCFLLFVLVVEPSLEWHLIRGGVARRGWWIHLSIVGTFWHFYFFVFENFWSNFWSSLIWECLIYIYINYIYILLYSVVLWCILCGGVCRHLMIHISHSCSQGSCALLCEQQIYFNFYFFATWPNCWAAQLLFQFRFRNRVLLLRS